MPSGTTASARACRPAVTASSWCECRWQLLVGSATPALFAVGAVLLLLVFIGIHNAWEVVTFLPIDEQHQPAGGQQAAGMQAERAEGA